MNNEQIYDSIVGIHKKIDDLTSNVSQLKIECAPIPWRLRILELIVYGGVALILVAAGTDIINKDKKADASQQNKTAIVSPRNKR